MVLDFRVEVLVGPSAVDSLHTPHHCKQAIEEELTRQAHAMLLGWAMRGRQFVYSIMDPEYIRCYTLALCIPIYFIGRSSVGVI